MADTRLDYSSKGMAFGTFRKAVHAAFTFNGMTNSFFVVVINDSTPMDSTFWNVIFISLFEFQSPYASQEVKLTLAFYVYVYIFPHPASLHIFPLKGKKSP